jgi:hypothetical protein
MIMSANTDYTDMSSKMKSITAHSSASRVQSIVQDYRTEKYENPLRDVYNTFIHLESQQCQRDRLNGK